ncbi:hypothetical protein F4U02_08785 [Acinetobacter haemolyticus]|uniref:hypothetical protein n=1 Tax=Acinetobacter haemolyticus TaxID=29430 RepID=UPI00129862BD|nr:hypothetical protein [Acinetobacter haemolyticus]MQZ31087.1 hypothetical protein [Acinetobacter haemolyticus]
MNDNKEEKQAFIKWAVRNQYDVSEISTVHGVLFKRQSTTDAWLGWLYSAKAKAEKLEGCVVVPVEPTEEMLIKGNRLALADKGYRYDAASIWETMIEAARGGNE